ncbi:hypothetical protein ASPCADRAFT_857 [Aspergillus carbonarius ITEM 5010]|uniref:Major facilitator superfamily (MFS) profile domain-containing protein n=1 Tax=Aspergillus carbonarius (strain ITEM 5010) TaxID=602072 RepID=A0A1R3S323_ASPC5|nr:hypothetical protein ASPCADRAFT_857 [Aspergillus carbonarius ITEM 5010]
MISLASQYWQIFLAQGLCIGLGQGLMWLPSVTVISTYFARNRVFAVTAAATGTSTGGMIFPAMIQYPTPQIDEASFKEPSYMLLTFGIFFLYWTLYFAFFYIQGYATENLGLASAAAMGLFAGTVPSLTQDISKIGTRVGMILTLMSVGPLM